jgi:hypothetical protein
VEAPSPQRLHVNVLNHLQLYFDLLIFRETWALPRRPISCYHIDRYVRLRTRGASSHSGIKW